MIESLDLASGGHVMNDKGPPHGLLVRMEEAQRGALILDAERATKGRQRERGDQAEREVGSVVMFHKLYLLASFWLRKNSF